MKIFIACSARDNIDNKYKNLATDLSTFLAKRGHKLVFGGVDTGMMGKCFYTFKYENGKTKGIADITDAEELHELDVNARDVTPTTFERTKGLFSSSDMAIILPGGIGTIAELFGMIDEVRTKKREYPIILFDFDNYYSSLLDFIKNAHHEGFILEDDVKLINIVKNIKSLENYIDELERKEEK